MAIRIVIDSASDISWEYADKHGIKVVPLSVTYYDKSFKEDREFDLEKHYSHYETDPNFLPKTSQPSPKQFLTVYEELAKEGAKDILVICISSAMSGTMNSARLAISILQNSYPDVQVHLIDSLNASFPEVFLAEEAVDLIKKGWKIDKIVPRLNELVKLLKTYIFIPNLKYLHLGGRISIAKYYLARLLKKKVITRVNEAGTNETAATVSDVDEGLAKIVQLTTENYTRYPRKFVIVHANDIENAKKLKEIVLSKEPKAEVRIIKTKCTISAHTGPGAVALLTDFG